LMAEILRGMQLMHMYLMLDAFQFWEDSPWNLYFSHFPVLTNLVWKTREFRWIWCCRSKSTTNIVQIWMNSVYKIPPPTWGRLGKNFSIEVKSKPQMTSCLHSPV
jgi:hypothetical protein